MNHTHRLALLGSLAGLLARCQPPRRPRLPPTCRSSSRQGKVLRRRAEGQERLRRGPGHHLCRHLEGGLPGQCLEACSEGNLHDDEAARRPHGFAGCAAARPAQCKDLKTLAECRPQRLRALPRRPCPQGPAWALKAAHYARRARRNRRPAFLEIHAENYLHAGGPAHRYLDEPAPRTTRCRSTAWGCRWADPIVPPRPRSGGTRRALLDRYEADSFSEHLAWSRPAGAIPQRPAADWPTRSESLARVVQARRSEAQEALGRSILIENPATYLGVRPTAPRRTAVHRRSRAPQRLRPAAGRQQHRRQCSINHRIRSCRLPARAAAAGRGRDPPCRPRRATEDRSGGQAAGHRHP